MSLKDIDELVLPSFYDHYDHELTTATSDSEDSHAVDDTEAEHHATDCLFSSFIEKAESLQHLVGMSMTKSHRRRAEQQNDQSQI